MTSVVTVFDADTVQSRLNDVLTAVTDCADALPNAVTLPAREIQTSANATWDCPMTYVMLLSVQLGLPEPISPNVQSTGQYTYPQANQQAWTLQLEAGIVRKITAVPSGMPRAPSPDPGKFTADLTDVSSDVAVLINAAMTLGSQSFQPVPHLVNAVASQGGFHGTAMTLTIEAWSGPV